MPDTGFVSDCLAVADSLETIDRAEMNKYLLPDQGPPTPYGTTPAHAGLHPMTTMATTMATMNSMNTMNSMTTTGGSSPCTAAPASLTSLPPIGSRLLPPAPVYGGPGSPYYTGGASPQPANHGSPDLPSELGTSVTSGGGSVSPGGSPGSPSGEFVELQPPRPLKEEPLPSLTMHKANVSPFLHQNLCYSSQPYAAFQYSYPYATMWH